MTHQENRSSSDVEREVEAKRAGLRETLDELSDRMTPGQVLDEAWQFARGSGGGDYVRNLGSSVRTNPLPVALIGAGIAWLMSGRGGGLPDLSRSRSRRDEEDMYESDRLYPSASRRFPHPGRDFDRGMGDPLTSLEVDGHENAEDSEGSGLLDKARSAVEGAREAVSGAVSEAGDSLSDGAGRAAGNLRHARDYAGERASAFSRDMTRRGRRFGRSALQSGRDVQQRANGFAEEQPLTLALAGLALGALVGAVARSTAAEARLMGEASDRVKEQAKGMMQDGVIESAAIVERTFEAVKDEAREQGLTTADAASAAETVTERVKKVAEKGKARFREEIGATASSSTTSKPSAGDVL